MAYLLMIPPILSALVLAAHFLRGYFSPLRSAIHLVLILVSLTIIPLVLIPRRWTIRLAQGLLLLGSAVWLLTLVMLVQERQEQDLPWTAAAIILGSVMLFTALSALLLETPPIRRRYLARSSPRFPVLPMPDAPPPPER